MRRLRRSWRVASRGVLRGCSSRLPQAFPLNNFLVDPEPPSQAEPKWAEPSLDDLDLSIPQVDCKFIGDLVRSRRHRRREFNDFKARVRAKLDADVKARKASDPTAKSMSDDLLAAECSASYTPDEQDALFHSYPSYEDDGFILIDCRTVDEITSWGMIEGAKVLPAHDMFEAFHMPPEDFEVAFGFAKPPPEKRIVFYCQFGPRSLMAAQILHWMGYPNVLHFRDGYYEWSKQFNILLRRWMEHDKESGNDINRVAAFEAAREVQRTIAPEFNELPMLEARRLVIDETRSRGKVLVGEGVREAAIGELESYMTRNPPTLGPEPAKPLLTTYLEGKLGIDENTIAKSRRQTSEDECPPGNFEPSPNFNPCERRY